jgi:flagellum-specific peptidoglycan hydrolase FlgJ
MRNRFIKAVSAVLAAVLFCLTAKADGGTPQEKYIAKYAATAVREMYRSGVPASITLAQGLLESNSGNSPLATKGNNHFGIKCHSNWTGKTMYYDDDRRKECFRSYDSPEESFRDHSDFLRYSDRYKSLFELKTTDYRGWAYGLKKAGYATDPSYPQKLIRNIEKYHLDKFDEMTLKETVEQYGYGVLDKSELSSGSGKQTKVGGKTSGGSGKKVAESSSSKGKQGVKKQTAAERRAARRAERAAKKASRTTSSKAKPISSKERGNVAPSKRFSDDEIQDGVIPESPLKIEEPKAYKARESYSYSLSREMLSRNGVPYITSVEGETYASIAEANGLFVKELLKYNDLSASEELLPGTIVYLQPKKSQGPKGLDKYVIAEDGESLREISQRFGIKLSSIYKMNGFGEDYVPREGDMITLREPAFISRVTGKSKKSE